MTNKNQGWQPIATAPKDWTNVISFDPARTETNDMGVCLSWFDTEDCFWCTFDGEFIKIEPTHWMPLPPPPEQEGGL